MFYQGELAVKHVLPTSRHGLPEIEVDTRGGGPQYFEQQTSLRVRRGWSLCTVYWFFHDLQFDPEHETAVLSAEQGGPPGKCLPKHRSRPPVRVG